MPNVGWLVGRAARDAGVTVPRRRWLAMAGLDAIKGLAVSAACLVAIDIAFEVTAPTLAFTMPMSMIILGLTSGTFQIVVSAAAARRAGLEASRSTIRRNENA